MLDLTGLAQTVLLVFSLGVVLLPTTGSESTVGVSVQLGAVHRRTVGGERGLLLVPPLAGRTDIFNSQPVHVLLIKANKERCVIRACSQTDTGPAGWGDPLGDGRFKRWMPASKEKGGKEEGQDKQDLHKRVWMDIKDGWHLHKHMHATYTHGSNSSPGQLRRHPTQRKLG